jgi:protein TonB
MIYYSADDYPAEARSGREQGKVSIQLAIGSNGRVSACTVTGSSGSASLDATTCRIAQLRARFAPARDAAGNALPATLNAEIKWRLPR